MRSKESAPGPKREIRDEKDISQDGPAREMDTARTVGARIRELRQVQGWTQDEFAHRSGLHRAGVGAIERGERNVTLRTMRIVADTLGVRIADLTEGL
jgi:DNA-binding XRE family transcriptional regulator